MRCKDILKLRKIIVIILVAIFLMLCNFFVYMKDKKLETKPVTNTASILEEKDCWESMELKDFLCKVNSIILTKNNTAKKLLISDKEFTQIINELEYIFDDAREMPAIGVSLDESTRNEMKSGEWIELCFEDRQYHNEMPFESLLINVIPEYTGFNIIRQYEGKFEGRCFYVDLMNGKTMKTLSNIIREI